METAVSKIDSGRRWLRFSLRAMLLLFIPVAIVLATYSYRLRQEKIAIHAHQLMTKKYVSGHFPSGPVKDVTYTFVRSNVVDKDLESFIPAFNGYIPNWPQVKLIRLNGSKVSPEAIERFRKAVPQCKIEP